MKPNLFSVAKGELSRDFFLAWLLQWGDSSNAVHNEDLNNVAKLFINTLIGEEIQIRTVKTGNHWKDIDIWANINDEIFIVIECKTNTNIIEHSKQLERNKKTVENYCKNRTFKLFCVYLKTGNESIAVLDGVKQIGYKVVDRKMVLKILNSIKTENDIFNDFLESLTAIENETNMYNKLENITKYRRTGQGFFLKLQENIDSSDWSYVYNKMGGVLVFWYYRVVINKIGELHIQIENAFYYGIKLVIKIQNQQDEALYKTLEELKVFANGNGLSLHRPKTFKTDKMSTLAIVENAFIPENNGDFDMNKFLGILRGVEKTLDEYKESKNNE